MEKVRHFIYSFAIVNFIFLSFALLAGCGLLGGGQDAVVIQMPFSYGYNALCTQGAGGAYSHTSRSTRYDIDFDTPNDRDDYVYAPIDGVAYVHDANEDTNFGIHINIDLGDGTYILLGHLSRALVSSEEEVAQGQLIALEGNTGNSSGDHIHIGRHRGDAWEDAVYGTSVEGLLIEAYDRSIGTIDELLTSEFVCGLTGGRSYQSRMQTPLWHPDGTLVMSPKSPKVYYLNDGYKHHIANEAVFSSYNWSFDQVVFVDESELSCYLTGAQYSDETSMGAVYSDGVVWLLVGAQDEMDYLRYRVPSNHWQAILKSWGIHASSYDDLPHDERLLEHFEESILPATFREGSLVRESTNSTVYAIMKGGAYPIEDWQTYIGLGFFDREVVFANDGAVAQVQSSVGDCRSMLGCISWDDVLACGGEQWGAGQGGSDGDGEDTGDIVLDTGDSDVPDDLGEGLFWVRTDGRSIGLHVPSVFSASVTPSAIAATGVGLVSDWSYSTDHLAQYDAQSGFAWYGLSDGWYRITMRTNSQWAFYSDYCESSLASSLCYANSDESYALCFAVQGNSINALSSANCRTLE